jgi:hypothetical protein
MSAEEPKTEAELLERESKLARAALTGLREEIIDSLQRTPDVAAWTKRYPWATLGTAAASGLATGVAVGRAVRKSPEPSEPRPTTESQPAGTGSAAPQATPPPAGRLVSGLGTLASAAMSAAAVAATQAVSEIVKSSIHEAMRADDKPPT